MNQLLSATPLLDFESDSIQALVQGRGWRAMDSFSKIKSVYEFVRDETPFDYNTDDRIPASKTLCDGYGQCNTKGILFMACLKGGWNSLPHPRFYNRQKTAKRGYDRICLPQRPR